jgi:hypothetical protein
MTTPLPQSVWQRLSDLQGAVGHRPETELPQATAVIEQLQGNPPKNNKQADAIRETSHQ